MGGDGPLQSLHLDMPINLCPERDSKRAIPCLSLASVISADQSTDKISILVFCLFIFLSRVCAYASRSYIQQCWERSVWHNLLWIWRSAHTKNEYIHCDRAFTIVKDLKDFDIVQVVAVNLSIGFRMKNLFLGVLWTALPHDPHFYSFFPCTMSNISVEVT